MRKSLQLLLFALSYFLALPAAHAQLPRPQTPPYSMTAMRRYLATASFEHKVTVAPSGDFATITAALAYVAAQPGRSDTNSWVVEVAPGLYTEANLTVPTYTLLTGWGDAFATYVFDASGGFPVLYDTTPTGDFVTLSAGSSLANLMVYAVGPEAGTYRAIRTTGNSSARNVGVYLDSVGSSAVGIEAIGGAFLGSGVTVNHTGSSTAEALVKGSGAGLILTYSHLARTGGTPAAMAKAVAPGTVRLEYTRIDTGATITLVNSGSTINIRSSPYASASGTITRLDGTALLAGVPGGQSLNGGVTTAENLTLAATSGNATPYIKLAGPADTDTGQITVKGGSAGVRVESLLGGGLLQANDTQAVVESAGYRLLVRGVGTSLTGSALTFTSDDTTATLNGCKIKVGAGAPEGAVTAPVCSLYLRTDGGAGTTLCVKESGAGSTGWVCK